MSEFLPVYSNYISSSTRLNQFSPTAVFAVLSPHGVTLATVIGRDWTTQTQISSETAVLAFQHRACFSWGWGTGCYLWIYSWY